MAGEKRPPKVVAEPTPATIQASTFKATCLELMDDLAARRAEIIVTKHGRPVVKVSPVDYTAPSPVGFLRNTVIDDSGIVDPEPGAWRESDADPLATTQR